MKIQKYLCQIPSFLPKYDICKESVALSSFKASRCQTGDVFVPQVITSGDDSSNIAKLALEAVSQELKKALELFNIKSTGNPIQDIALISEMALKDKLSGLGNKMALITDLERYKKDSQNNLPMSVAMFDMDNFKSVNDLLGYDIGDKFIQIIGSKIKNVLNGTSYKAYRFGGEEFVILFPGTKSDEAAIIANKALNALNNDGQMGEYTDEYQMIGKRMVKKLEGEQKDLSAIKNILANIGHLDELIKERGETIANTGDATFLTTKKTELENEFASGLKALIEKTLNCENISEREKRMLTRHLASLTNFGYTQSESLKTGIQATELADAWNIAGDAVTLRGELGKIARDPELKMLLDSKYNNGAKIAQIEKWLSAIERSKGFTITCGVREFSDLSDDAESIVAKTGKVLCKGKQTDKGKLYV